MLRTRTTTLDAIDFELAPLIVCSNRNLVTAITKTPFEIYYPCRCLADTLQNVLGENVLYFL